MRNLRYLSVCSGIEAATVAWHSLGFEPVAFADIEEFPSAVLAHHYPAVPNLGDMSKFNQWPDHAIDLLVGGTPCQAFSVAGLREGLADPRGNLALTFLALARRYRPRWVVWENVPGVHSSWSDAAHRAPSEKSRGIIDEARRAAELLGLDGSALLGGDAFEEVDQSSDFDCFLAGLEELGYGWATRVLDAQYFGVAQRRRRVFVVAHLGARAPAAAVLFEPESLRGDPPPSRQSGQGVAAESSSGVEIGGYSADSLRVAGTLDRKSTCANRGCQTNESDFLVPAVVGALQHGAPVGGGSTGKMPTAAESLPAISHCLNADAMGRRDSETETLIPMPQGGFFDDVAHTLRAAGFDASEDGTGRGTPLVADVAPTLGKESFSTVKSSSGQMADFCVAIRTAQTGANGEGLAEEVAHTLDRAQGQAIAFDSTQITHPENRSNPQPGDPAPTTGPQVMSGMSVRRLTPIECERLQGFPDNYTRIPWGGAPAEECPDGHRYRALGNSMAVPVMRWIGERIQLVDEILEKEAAEKSA
jgi:DNA (cytosine-5)-methyltransferase 1